MSKTIEDVEYRGYFFVNANYLKEVQWGIQSLHCTAEIFLEYNNADRRSTDNLELQVLNQWAYKYKTVIILNGGNHLELNYLWRDIVPLALELNLPYGIFNEDDQSLNGATTCVGIILPASVFALPLEPAYVGWQREPVFGPIPQVNIWQDTPQRRLKEIISKYHLAR